MSGYDIRREAATSIGHFWSESYGQIYPALRDLASTGLIRERTGRASGGRERRVYELTARGRESLRAWREREPARAPVRNELLLKLFLCDEQSVERTEGWIQSLLAEEKSRLATYAAIRGQLLEERRDHPSLPFWLATLSFGEHRSRAATRWCRETIRTLQGSRPRATTEGTQDG